MPSRIEVLSASSRVVRQVVQSYRGNTQRTPETSEKMEANRNPEKVGRESTGMAVRNSNLLSPSPLPSYRNHPNSQGPTLTQRKETVMLSGTLLNLGSVTTFESEETRKFGGKLASKV